MPGSSRQRDYEEQIRTCRDDDAYGLALGMGANRDGGVKGGRCLREKGKRVGGGGGGGAFQISWWLVTLLLMAMVQSSFPKVQSSCAALGALIRNEDLQCTSPMIQNVNIAGKLEAWQT